MAPGGDEPFIDMTGFRSLFYAIKPSNGGNYRVEAVMGTDTQPFANLTPVNAANTLKGKMVGINNENMASIFVDSAEAMTADVWNIFIVQNVLQDQKNMQLAITNNSGGNSDIEYGFMRLV